jgi:hypothetical protein
MQREDILELILLEADGGLSLEDSARLEDELARDPTLRDERSRMQSAWKDVKDLGRGLAMRPEFGESRLASLRAPRREGVIIGGHVRAAAAALLLATFARGSFDPRTSIVVDRFGADANGAAVRSTATADETIRAANGESVVASSIDGLRVNLRNGGVSLSADGDVRIEPGPIAADVMIGERAARIDLGGLELIGTQASFAVNGEYEDRKFMVLSGSLRLNDFTGRVFTRLDGEVRVGPDKSAAGFNPIVSGNPLIDPATVPTRTETSVEPPPEPAREHSDPTRLMNRSFAPAHLAGTITAASDGTAVAGAVVTLVRDLLPKDALKALLPDDPELRLETRRDLDTARAVLGGAFTVASDANGRFDLPRLPPGIWRIDVQVPDESRFADLRDHFFAVRAGEELALPLALEDGATAFGRIVDSKGRAVTNAILMRLNRTIHTDWNGDFKLEHVSATDGRATIRANDFVLTDVDLSTQDFNAITLSRSIPIRGVIRDHDGTPIAGRIEAGFEVNGAWHVERANVDAVEGKFSLRTIPSGVAVRLVASSRGFQVATRYLDPDASRSDKFYFDLPADRSVTVFPYDVDFGRPVSDAEVLAYGSQELLPGVEETVGFSLSGLDADNDTAAIVCSAGLCFTTFSFAPNATEVHVEMRAARDRRVRVVDPSGNDVSDALVVWSARMNEDPRVLAAVPAIGLPDYVQLPDFGLDGGGLVAQIVVTSNGTTTVVDDDPTKDEITVVLGGSDQ